MTFQPRLRRQIELASHGCYEAGNNNIPLLFRWSHFFDQSPGSVKGKKNIYGRDRGNSL